MRALESAIGFLLLFMLSTMFYLLAGPTLAGMSLPVFQYTNDAASCTVTTNGPTCCSGDPIAINGQMKLFYDFFKLPAHLLGNPEKGCACPSNETTVKNGRCRLSSAISTGP